MTILGLDPGPEQSALVGWNGVDVTLHFTMPNDDLRRYLARWVKSAGDVLVVEKIEAMGMAVGATTFETVFHSGRFVETWGGHPNEWARVSRRDVKLHLCGNMRAKDANIRQRLIDLIGPIGTAKSKGPLYGVKGHEFSALAVALTYAETRTR